MVLARKEYDVRGIGPLGMNQESRDGQDTDRVGVHCDAMAPLYGLGGGFCQACGPQTVVDQR
ncbi:MAG TPA: hypothetical protein VHP11_17295 [Tepidisphaeraceae bacterium]|nr:hypothetical protein [Tepidisphaeraceae bacterium]